MSIAKKLYKTIFPSILFPSTWHVQVISIRPSWHYEGISCIYKKNDCYEYNLYIIAAAIQLEYTDREESINGKIAELRDSMSRGQQKADMKRKQLEENNKQIQMIGRQLARVGGASTMFDQLDRDLKHAVS